MTAKTNTYKKKMAQCFIFLFATEAKEIIFISKPWNPSIQPRTSHQFSLSMKATDYTNQGTVQTKTCPEISVFSMQAWATYSSRWSIINVSHALAVPLGEDYAIQWHRNHSDCSDYVCDQTFTLYTTSPSENFLPLPVSYYKMSLEGFLNDPPTTTTPLQASFTVIHHPCAL